MCLRDEGGVTRDRRVMGSLKGNHVFRPEYQSKSN